MTDLAFLACARKLLAARPRIFPQIATPNALTVATAHDLVGWRINFLYQLGTDEGIRDGEPDRLVEALLVARQAGAAIKALDIELELALLRLCRGETAAAAAGAARCERDAARLRLEHLRLEALGVRIMAAAHQGQRDVVAQLDVHPGHRVPAGDQHAARPLGQVAVLLVVEAHEHPGLGLGHAAPSR